MRGYCLRGQDKGGTAKVVVRVESGSIEALAGLIGSPLAPCVFLIVAVGGGEVLRVHEVWSAGVEGELVMIACLARSTSSRHQ